MKRLTLDQTWEQCLAMWKDIAGRVGTATEATVKVMKIQWLSVNDPDSDLCQNCYFCEYTTDDSESGQYCVECPGQLIDDEFNCEDPEYDFDDYPRLFYAELKRLNKIRLAKK